MRRFILGGIQLDILPGVVWMPSVVNIPRSPNKCKNDFVSCGVYVIKKGN